MTKPFHVFISYAFEDEALATEISNALTFRGLRVWFAPLSLKFGDKLLDSINAGLVASEYGLIILSPTYIAKAWTSYELDVLHRQHIEQGKKAFPLVARDRQASTRQVEHRNFRAFCYEEHSGSK